MRGTTHNVLHLSKKSISFQIVIAGAFYPNYFSLGQCDEEIAVKNLTGRDPKTTVMVC